MKNIVPKLTILFLSAAALTACDAPGPDKIDESNNEAFYNQILLHNATNKPSFNPDDKEGTGWYITDPDTDNQSYIYSFDCDFIKMSETFPSEDFLNSDYSIHACMGFSDGEPATYAINDKIDDDVPVYVITHNMDGNNIADIIFDVQLSYKKLSILEQINNELIAFRHEEGHAMDFLLGGIPDDLRVAEGDGPYEQAWREAVSDSYGILSNVKDTGSLRDASIWVQFRLALALPLQKLYNGDIELVDPIYFHPFVLEASLKKAQELLSSGEIDNMSDIERAKLARQITEEHLMDFHDWIKFNMTARGAWTYFKTYGFDDVEASLQAIIQSGRYENDAPEIQRIRRAVGFFRHLDELEGHEPTLQNVVLPPMTVRGHSAPEYNSP